MAFTAYPAVATGDPWTASDNNLYNRANINELIKYTAAGQIAYASGSNTLSVLDAGDNYQVLESYDSAPRWVNGARQVIQASGDLIYGSAAHTLSRLPIGSNNQVLGVVSGALSWIDLRFSPAGTKVFNGSAVNVSNFSFTTLPWNGEYFDDNGWHSTVTNNSRITVDEGGRYLCGITVLVNTQPAGYRELGIKINGFQEDDRANFTVDQSWWSYGNIFLNLSAGDYVEAYVYQGTGATMSVAPKSFYLLKVG